MRESILAVGVLSAALLACGYSPAGSFRARSVSTPTDQICYEAIELGEDDSSPVGEAGGVKIGVYSGDPDGVPLGRDVAYYGGTHFMIRGARSSESGGRFVPGGWVKTHRTVITADVYRVPVRAWDLLPAALRPVKP